MPSFALWCIVFFLFDRQIYMVFSTGQFRVRLEIGEAETAYDTTGMTIQKQRSDLFRHAQRLSLAYHDQRRSGMIIYAINSQADAAARLS